jgi:secreted PhoX family phosphatase
VVYFVTKELKRMYILNLRTLRYTSQPTNFGDFDGQPDQVVRVYRDDYDLLFFTEDGGDRPGIYAHRTSRSADEVLTILESSVYVNADQETTGLAFSPDRRRMYFAIQDAGIIYEVRRVDGLPFDGRSLNVQYNNVNARSRHRFGGRGL